MRHDGSERRVRFSSRAIPSRAGAQALLAAYALALLAALLAVGGLPGR
jgi:hypothetical protein